MSNVPINLDIFFAQDFEMGNGLVVDKGESLDYLTKTMNFKKSALSSNPKIRRQYFLKDPRARKLDSCFITLRICG